MIEGTSGLSLLPVGHFSKMTRAPSYSELRAMKRPDLAALALEQLGDLETHIRTVRKTLDLLAAFNGPGADAFADSSQFLAVLRDVQQNVTADVQEGGAA